MTRPRPIALFWLATLGAAASALAGAALGGPWALAGPAWLIAWSVTSGGAAAESVSGRSPRLPVILGLTHFAVLFGAIAALADGIAGGWPAGLAAFLGVSLFLGQVSHPVAHELIHRPARGAFWLGALVYASFAFGHHASAHRLVHHRAVGTPDDPNTPRRGQSFWRFARRAALGSFRAGLAAEGRRRSGANPYPAYIAATLAAAALAAVLGGWTGLALWAGFSANAVLQLLLSDYVQHYGLRRGDPAAPVSAGLSWDAPALVPHFLMLNAPSHAAHHLHPARPFEDLSPEAQAPRMPRPLAVMAFVAMFPRWWRRVMDPRLDALAQMSEP